MTRHVIGVFGEVDQAHRAVEAFLSQGISEDRVSVLRWEDPGHGEELLEYDQAERAEAINSGMWSGGALGAIAGLLAGAFSIVAAPFGAVAVMGALSSGLGGAAIGATMGGFVGSLMKLGLTRESAEHLIQRLEEGATIIAVAAPTAEAADLLNRMKALGAEEALIE